MCRRAEPAERAGKGARARGATGSRASDQRRNCHKGDCPLYGRFCSREGTRTAALRLEAGERELAIELRAIHQGSPVLRQLKRCIIEDTRVTFSSRAEASPLPILRALDERRAMRIRFHIAEQDEESIDAFATAAPVTLLKDVTEAARICPGAKFRCVAPCDPVHVITERFLCLWFDHDVKVIRHETERDHLDRRSLFSFAQERHKPFVIAISKEHPASLDTAVDNVEDRARTCGPG